MTGPPYFFLMHHSEQRTSQLKQGYLCAVRLLAASRKSGNELLKRLLHKGYDPEVSKEIIEKLKAQKLVDDQKFVHDTVQWTFESKRLGRNRIILELKKRGIGKDAIQKALEMLPEIKERQMAQHLAEERWLKLSSVEPKKKRRRLYDFLANRGFDFELCREIVSQFSKNRQ